MAGSARPPPAPHAEAGPPSSEPPTLKRPSRRIALMHGTTQAGYESISKQGIGVKFSSNKNLGLGRGFYLTEDVAVAEAGRVYHQTSKNPGGMTHILVWEIPIEDLGRVVDVRPGGAHRVLWERYLESPPFFARKRMPSYGQPGFRTNREYLSGIGSENRAMIFEHFLKENGLDGYDTVFGEIGTDVSGGGVFANMPPSEQVVIRSKAVADRLNRQMRGEPRQ
jgi:hypothetical protein